MKEKKKTIRCLDKLGRIVIPKEIRSKFEILEEDPMEIFVDRNSIILRKHEVNCAFCSNTKGLIEYKNKLICSECKEKIGNLISK